jgi:hypothetical protein
LEAAAWSLVIASVMSFLLHFQVVKDVSGITLSAFVKTLYSPFKTSVFLCFVAFIMKTFSDWAIEPSTVFSELVCLMTMAAIFGLCYIAAIWLQKHFIFYTIADKIYKAREI